VTRKRRWGKKKGGVQTEDKVRNDVRGLGEKKDSQALLEVAPDSINATKTGGKGKQWDEGYGGEVSRVTGGKNARPDWRPSPKAPRRGSILPKLKERRPDP